MLGRIKFRLVCVASALVISGLLGGLLWPAVFSNPETARLVGAGSGFFLGITLYMLGLVLDD